MLSTPQSLRLSFTLAFQILFSFAILSNFCGNRRGFICEILFLYRLNYLGFFPWAQNQTKLLRKNKNLKIAVFENRNLPLCHKKRIPISTT